MDTSTETPEIPEIAIGGPVRRTIAILGAGGDLTERLLLPGIAKVVDASPEVEVHLIGAARTPQSRDEWRGVVRRSLEAASVSAATIDGLVARSEFVATDASSPEELRELLDACPTAPLLYIALPPAMGKKVAAALAELELPGELRIAIEKPFGESEADARELNEALAKVVPDERLWRIDHFLGTPAAVELMRSREVVDASGVPLVEASEGGPLGRVEIVFEEELGIEGRGAFYDETGALRDMLQSHLMLMLALTAMERPGDQESARDAAHPGEPAGTLDDAMIDVLRNVSVWDDEPVSARRARYTAGEVGGKQLPAYVDEEDVEPERGTETLAEITLRVETPRWRGIPFLLRSGKAIGAARQEIVLTPADPGAEPTRIPLDAPADDNSADPYARVIAGMLGGSTLLSVRGDVAEELWRIVGPVLDAWDRDAGDLGEYEAGSAGEVGNEDEDEDEGEDEGGR
ncbi:glucose-6-phosphate dehydrogenase [Pseudoclavibacter sp. AY1H1]|uniref:glucose-6-phosphate dehydrogenase n=1 Tax=Pseudoclavibacter sp. AY1H1 TaxID=2080584 RepID=UPI000CE90EA0|nr:glucose-6-phosphate dehydrogenase [Pseudoclavibacter sp. AY1H1]PPF34905.1 glucose-6-phosphate dehydrogenase [Pseudoclavibacter sp. AY1H1]